MTLLKRLGLCLKRSWKMPKISRDDLMALAIILAMLLVIANEELMDGPAWW
jgi:hypothetical protein